MQCPCYVIYIHQRPCCTRSEGKWVRRAPCCSKWEVGHWKQTQRSWKASDWILWTWLFVVTKNMNRCFWHINGNQLHVNQKNKQTNILVLSVKHFLYITYLILKSLTFSGISFSPSKRMQPRSRGGGGGSLEGQKQTVMNANTRITLCLKAWILVNLPACVRRLLRLLELSVEHPRGF